MSKLTEQLKRHEGFRRHPYHCTAGKLTIGYGRNLDDNGISEQEATDMLHQDVKSVRAELEYKPWFAILDRVRQDCIVNMAFNLGVPKLEKFVKMINALSLSDYGAAANEMIDSKWARQVGDRANELATQMKTGEYQ